MPTTNFGPWTTSLTTGSRLELSAFWKGRLTRLAAVADGRFVSQRQRVSTLVLLVVVTAMFPMFRAQSEPPLARGPLPNDVVDSARSVGIVEPGAPREAETFEVALGETAVKDAASDDPHAREFQLAVRDAMAYLSGQQRDDGSWNGQPGQPFQTGISSLGALALAKAGVKPNDLRLRRAAVWLRAQQPEMTYEVALQTLALCALEPKRDAELIQRNATRLEEGQTKKGPNAGSWSYGIGAGLPQGGGDNSNADFAIWGLDAAARAGAKIRRETWEAALGNWLRGQNPDGGWTYSQAGPSTGSMTSAGVASVAICLSHLTNDDRQPTEDERAAIDRGREWMTKNFATGHNPGAVASQWLIYYAVMFRRAADITKTERFGDHDWRREFADYFVSQRNLRTGAWVGSGTEANPVMATSLVLLALVGADPLPPAGK